MTKHYYKQPSFIIVVQGRQNGANPDQRERNQFWTNRNVLVDKRKDATVYFNFDEANSAARRATLQLGGERRIFVEER